MNLEKNLCFLEIIEEIKAQQNNQSIGVSLYKLDIAFASRTLFYLASYFDNLNISQVGIGTHPVRSMGTAGKNSRILVAILHAALPYMYDSISEITASIMQAIKVSLMDDHVLSIDCYPRGFFDDFAQGVVMVWQRSADTSSHYHG